MIDNIYFGNGLYEWCIAGGLFLVLLTVLVATRTWVKRHLKKQEESGSHWYALLFNAVCGTHHIFSAIISLYAASLILEIPKGVEELLHSAAIVALMLQVAIWGHRLITQWVEIRYRENKDENPGSISSIHLLGLIARMVLYIIVLLMVLQNLGIKITTLVASLGVGSVAVALALQNVLGDLFACIAISMDKPFVVGDFIIIGEFLGIVERIGLKTTRIRSLSGEQLIFSNNDLLSSRIRNYKRMFERRVVFTFGVIYQTTYEQLQRIPGFVKEFVEQQEPTRFDRAHFKGYGDSSLDFEVVYYIQSPDYNTYMDIQQAINLALFKKFEEEGISFAYPTRTLYIEGGKKPV